VQDLRESKRQHIFKESMSSFRSVVVLPRTRPSGHERKYLYLKRPCPEASVNIAGNAVMVFDRASV